MAVQACPVMHIVFASQDVVYHHIYSGSRHVTYADTPAVACAQKVAEQVHQFVPLVLAPTAVSVLQDFAIRNLLLVLLAAVLSVISAPAVLSAAALVATSTAVAASHTCTGCAILVMQDPVMYTNLLLLQQVYLLKRAVLSHPRPKKIQSIRSGQVQGSMNTCIL